MAKTDSAKPVFSMHACADDMRDEIERDVAMLKARLKLIERHQAEFDALVEAELAARRAARSA